MRLLKIFTVIVILAIVIIGALVFYAQRLDWNTVKPEVEERISKAVGRKFEITGDLHFTLFPLPRVSADGLRLANAEWGSAPLMLEAKAVSFTIAPLSILLGDPRATAITLDGVELLLEENADGRDNWDLDDVAAGDSSGDSSGQTVVFAKLRSVKANDVDVVYRQPGADPIRFHVDSARIGAKAIGSGQDVIVTGTLNDSAFSVKGALSPMSDFLLGRGLKGQVSVQASGFELSMNGDFGRPPSLVGTDFEVRGKGGSVPKIGALDGLPEDLRGEWQADLRFAGVKDGYRISDADVRVGEFRLRGDLTRDHTSGYRGELDIEGPDYKLNLDGQFGSLDGTQGLDATVKGSGTRLPAVGTLASFQEQIRAAWDASFHVNGTSSRLDLKDVSLKLGRSDLSGTLSLDRAGPRPRIEGKLTSELLDIALFWGVGDDSPEAQKSGKARGGKVFGDESVSLAWMKLADASLVVAAKRLEGNIFKYTDTLLRITLEQGRMKLVSEQGTIYGATASGELLIDASVEPPKLLMEAKARGADVGKIMRDWSEPPFMTGQGDFEIKLSFTGNSLATLMSTLSGETKIVVGEGQAEVGVLERMVRTVGLKTIGNLLGQEKVDTVPMNCFAANLSAEAGVVKADVLVMDTDRASIFGSGTVDLGKEKYDLLFKPKPKSVTLNTAVPIRLGGTFRDPTVSAEKVGALRKLAGIASLFVFPPAAIAGLVDFGAENNQCVKLAAESK